MATLPKISGWQLYPMSKYLPRKLDFLPFFCNNSAHWFPLAMGYIFLILKDSKFIKLLKNDIVFKVSSFYFSCYVKQITSSEDFLKQVQKPSRCAMVNFFDIINSHNGMFVVFLDQNFSVHFMIETFI